MNEKSMLFVPRLPARLDLKQAAEILGFLPHELTVLLKVGLLKPLGKPAANGHKFFCSVEISALSADRDWLDKATRAVSRHWKERNFGLKSRE